MNLTVIEETPDILPEYEKIPIAFRAESVYRVELLENGLGGVKFIEEALEKPFVKDYDANPYERPTRWSERFDIKHWGILAAFDGGKRIGGAAVAWKTPELFMPGGSEDMACLWDLRVLPDYRGQGAGQQLFTYALDWARRRNCRELKIETQNINVQACKFYVRQDCRLGAINRYAYPELDETQLIWYRDL